ncbi:protein kinase family protein [Terracoccus luteus]|uniref:Uncharacterized protein n=1 Tax=Terracoccus luteus TaxID=53356 RepID=A0A839PSJ5_9MICO|nr:protein kinase family protein [Terracoccus luteus]MBB2987248.1 hypothetical protein [Terracoccus luteus]MCP2172899.1 hypothetical protein [Terracoccus luteus]
MQGVGPGSTLGGRYAVTQRIAVGTHHERWRADDRTLDREVVLVCFTTGTSVAAGALDAARRAAGIEDQRLTRVLDVGADGDVSFIVEEPLTDAATLGELLDSGGLPAEEVRRLVGETSSALDKARHRGLHHLALTPDSVLRMPDGAVKVRGLATDAALVGVDDASDAEASRRDALGLVKLVYAGLTARWPVARGERAALAYDRLEGAPSMVGGPAAPSEIVVGVPNDLDLICRMTLRDDRGPVSPGDLAVQIAPWPSRPPAGDGAGGLQTSASPRSGSRRPAGDRAGRSGGAGVGGAAGAAGVAGAAAAGTSDRSSSGDRGDGTRELEPITAEHGVDVAPGAVAVGEGAGPAPTDDDATRDDGIRAGSDGNESTNGTDVHGVDEVDTRSRTGGIAAAGAAAAGAAGAIGDRVGSFARAAAERAQARAAERRASHAERDGGRTDDPDDDGYDDDISFEQALDEAPPTEIDPPLPVFHNDAPERPSQAGSRIALAVIGALVVVGGVIGVQNVLKIGQSDAAAPTPVPTVTSTRPTAPAPSSSAAPAPTTTTPAAASEVEIAGGTGFDPQDDGTEADQNVKRVYDGDDGTGWRSRWYGTDDYNGNKDGVGVALDLGSSVTVTEVTLDLPATQDVTVYVNTKESLDGAQEVGSVKDDDGTVKLTAPSGLKPGDVLLVWVTKPALTAGEAPNHYRAQINEVTVRGT